MATGLASCSGLSILLAGACRAVGVPARIVGTPMWSNGHGNLNDRDKIVEMYPHVRNLVPMEISWLQTDGVIRDFFWLSSSNPAKKREINASRRNNTFTVTSRNGAQGSILLDARMVDFSRPIDLSINAQKSRPRVVPSLKILCETMARRGDPELAFSAQLPLQ
jgi:hypothetical protein